MAKADSTTWKARARRILERPFRSLPPALQLRIEMAREHGEFQHLLGSQMEVEKRLLQRTFREKLGYELDLDRPRSFNEKVQWRKLFDRRRLFPMLSDKFEVRAYVESRVGRDHLIPLLHVSKRLDRTALHRFTPPFIVKPNHASGLTLPIRTGESLEQPRVGQAIADSLWKSQGILKVEWGYWDIEPRVIVEELLLDEKGNLPDDFKFHCFGGEVHFIQVATGPFNSLRRSTYLDRDWSRLPMSRSGLRTAPSVPRPDTLEAMIEVAQALSSGIDYVRVDLYSVRGRIYFGEMTLYPSSGFGVFSPEEWDFRWGALWHQAPATPARHEPGDSE